VETRSEGITRLLRAAAGGDGEARAALLPLVYEELKALARARLARAGARRQLETTELVHEAWLRLVPAADTDWESRKHFFGVAARAMRNVLVEDARRRLARKRDGASADDRLEELAVTTPLEPEDLLALAEAIERFGADHPAAAEVVAQRFFNGLTMPEVAEVLGLSLATAEREWRFARAWLRQVLEHEPPE
jgi:RNA polymerase sigma factor (TIGR02999 family)